MTQTNDVAADMRRRATQFLQDAQPLAPEWQHAELDPQARVLRRPDIAGTAYYEFQVLAPNATEEGLAPAGYMILASDDHDFPIPNWSSHGEAPSRRLERSANDQGKQAVTFYKLDGLSYAAEDADGNRAALLGLEPVRVSASNPGVLGADTRPADGAATLGGWSSWQELRDGFGDAYQTQLTSQREQARNVWDVYRQAEGEVGVLGTGVWGPWAQYWAGDVTAQRLYTQIPPHTGLNTSGCYSGCGATAWAMLFGWASYQAWNGNATWAPHSGIYRVGGGRGAPAQAPLANDAGVNAMTWEISQQVDCFCNPFNDNGATAPWNMGDVSEYLSGRCGARVDTHYNSVGVSEDRLRDFVINSIARRSTPAIIGTGWLEHYPLAWGYSQRGLFDGGTMTSKEEWFYVNEGFGTPSTWVSTSTWFAGELYP